MDTLKSLSSASFLNFVMALDAQLAQNVLNKGCLHCQGKLHFARYPRKNRTTLQVENPKGWNDFYSLCCSKEGCRKRHRPKSVRYAGRSPHSAATLLLFRVLKSGGAQKPTAYLCKLMEISPKTVRRWIRFWNSVQRKSSWWRNIAARFSLSGKDLADFYACLKERLSTEDAFKILLQESANLWAEIKIFGVEELPAKHA